ncbi:MAG: hypothetical protein JWR26_4314 [Pedosphaera sp.]|nr:hypothetical protein [Pedosphaera sp.]
MKLHSPQFEKALRKGVKRRIKNSPELKRKYREANKYRRHYRGYVLIRPLISLALGVVVWRIFAATQHPASALAMVSLWTALFVFVHVGGLAAKLFASTDLGALIALPVTEETIFSWELQKFFRSALWSLGDLLAALGALALCLEFGAAKWAAVLLVSVLAWLSMLSLSALCLTRFPKLPYRALGMAVYPACFGIYMFGKTVGWGALVAVIDRYAPNINLLLPTGWPISLFQLLLPHPLWMTCGLIVPIAVVIYTFPNSLFRLRRYYTFREFSRPQASDLVPPNEGPSENQPEELAHPRSGNAVRLGPTAITEIIQSRGFLAKHRWPTKNRFEKLLWQWLTPREQALSELMFPRGMSIVARWKKVFRNLAIAVVFAFTAGFASATAKMWIICAGIFVTSSVVISLLYESGRAFQAVICSGVRIPLYTNFATGFFELSRLMLKITAMQTPALLVWTTACGVLIANFCGLPVLEGVMYGLRGGALLFATRFIAIVFSFSSCTNDTTVVGFRSLMFALSMIGMGIVFLVLGGIGLFLPNLGLGWLITVCAMLDAFFIFRIYAWFYNRNTFDLMLSLQRRR